MDKNNKKTAKYIGCLHVKKVSTLGGGYFYLLIKPAVAPANQDLLQYVYRILDLLCKNVEFDEV